jgi:hypothetical protein
VTNRNKAKGTAWESEIVTELRAQGHDSARRVVQAGAADVGDVHLGAILSPLVAIEAKNEKALTFSSYVDEAKREGDNAGALYGGVAWVKRRGKASARDGYVVMDGQTFIDILHALDTQLARGGALPHHVVLPPSRPSWPPRMTSPRWPG